MSKQTKVLINTFEQLRQHLDFEIGFDLNQKWEQACRLQDANVIKWLIGQGFDVNDQNRILLRWIIAHNNVELLIVLKPWWSDFRFGNEELERTKKLGYKQLNQLLVTIIFNLEEN